MKLKLVFAVCVFVCGVYCHSQDVTITGQVLDPTGKIYQNGSGVVSLQPGNVQWLTNGTNPVTTPIPIAQLDAFGRFSVTLTNTSLIQPAASNPQGQFSFCSDPTLTDGSTICFTMTPMTLTSSQNISAQIQAQSAPSPIIPSGSGFYQTIEDNGVSLTQRPILNLIPGTNIAIGCVDNSGATRTDCTVTNTGSGVPNRAAATFQVNGGSGAFFGAPGVLLAIPTGREICNNATGITALIASLPNGGTIYVPASPSSPGYFTCTPTTSGFGIVNTTQSIKLIGAGWDNPLNTAAASTTLLFPASVVGIDNTGANVVISDMNLVSGDTGANTDDGIRNRGGSTTIVRVGIKHFGRNGLLTLGESPTTADSWHYTQVESANNYGDGFQWGTPCSDNHQGHADLLIASNNAGYGFNVQCGLGNRFDSPLGQGNTLGDYNLGSGASYNVFNNTYCETGAGSTFTMASGLLGVDVNFRSFGQCQTITNSGGGTAAGNQIYWTGLDGWPGYSTFWLLGQPGASGNHSYGFSVGTYATSDLGLFDATAGKWLVNYDPTTYWNFDQTVTVPNFTITGQCIGCLPSSIPIDNQFGTSYTIPSSDAGKLVASVNTGSVAWTGPALANNISFTAYNRDPGTVTYTPASGTVNGTATQIIPPNWFGTEYTDNSNTYLLLAPSIFAFPSCSANGSFLNFTTATGVIGCASTSAVGTVTHTAGALTAGQIMLGKGGADSTVDPDASSDGAGNFSLTSVKITGGGAFATLPTCTSGIEGTLSHVTDSTTNTWGAAITGGSTNHVLAYCDGSAWTVAAK